ncbi:MAG: ATP-grasp domain-containing protein [Bordetella sp.]|nr:ATP-grasp domain-containing protein [Bordetella sp.]
MNHAVPALPPSMPVAARATGPVRVLVFPSGTEVGQEIGRALERSLHVQLHGASSRDDHGALAFARHARLPSLDAPDFDARFRALLAEWRIELVFATHDSVQDYLAPRIASWGAVLANGDPEACHIARSKRATLDTFAHTGWTPRRHDDPAAVTQWPVAVKPDAGQGGQGFARAEDAATLAQAMAAVAQPLVTEYLPGEEISVDCFSDRHRRLLYVGPRSRERVVGGIAMRSRPLPADATVGAIAEAINARLVLRGPWFLQLRRDAQGRWKLLEFSCRLSTGSTVARAAGVNLPLLAVQDFLERDVRILAEPRLHVLERRLEHHAVLDYAFDTCYFDLDDTVICNGIANPAAMRLAYRLLELGKRLVLLTRHPGDIARTLAAARIAPGLFDDIVHLRQGEPKSSAIRAPALFIDNHFPERLEVSRHHGIPVFDVDALDLLYR